MAQSQHRKRALVIDRRRQEASLEKKLLSGVTNITEIAAAYGISKACAFNRVKRIEAKWRRRDEGQDPDTRRISRVKQLENILRLALNSFGLSMRDTEEWIFKDQTCVHCGGMGRDEVMPEEFVTCKHCEGKGHKTLETIKVSQNQGDHQFLNVAIKAITEAARIEGTYPTSASVRGLVAVSKEVGGEVERQVSELYYEGPTDLIIRARDILDEMKETGEMKALEVERA